MSAYLKDRSLETKVRFYAERNEIRDLSFMIWLVYSTVLEGSPLQGTLGKAICRIKVVDRDGNRLSYGRAVTRNGAKLLSYLPLCLGFVWAAFSRQMLTWHDKIAKTFVIIR